MGDKISCDEREHYAELLRVMKEPPPEARVPASNPGTGARPSSTSTSQPRQPPLPVDNAFEAKLLATCNRVLGATTKLYETGGEQAVLEFERGSGSVLRECQRRNIPIRPAAMDREIDAQLKEVSAQKQALEAQQKGLDSAICSKQNQMLTNVFELEGIDGFLKEESAILRANPKCSQLGLHTRPPAILELVRLCRVYNDLTIQSEKNKERIRDLEARAKAAQLKIPSRPNAARDKRSDLSMRETCTQVGVSVIAERR
jgi:hypothetical protein